MEKVLIEYNAFIGALYKKEENIGKDEKDLMIEYNLANRVYAISQCGHLYRRKFNLPIGSYIVKPILVFKYGRLSELTYDSTEIIGIEVSKEELSDIKVPYSLIYEFNDIQGNICKRNIDNIYLMEKLSDLELNGLHNPEDISYYNQYSRGVRYVKEQNPDGTICLTAIHEDGGNLKEYYVCDETYPEGMKELISYLKVNSRETFSEESLPERQKANFLSRLFKKENK